MATKTITITEEAYDRLRALKRDDESFTDVVLRMTEEAGDRMDGFGAWTDTDLREAVEEVDEEFEEDLEDRHNALSGH